MPDRVKRGGSQDAKVQTIRGRPANLKGGNDWSTGQCTV